MEDDIKYQFEKIIAMLEDMKRLSLGDIKQKLQDLDLRDVKEALKDIKSRLDNIESKIQK